MGVIRLIARLVRHDLTRRRTEALLLLGAIAATTTTLTLGLSVRQVTDRPWERTRAVTAGPDAVASAADPAALSAVASAPEVIAAERPFAALLTELRLRDMRVDATVHARAAASAAVDRPLVTSGSWSRAGGVVVERAFAGALRVRPGDTIKLGGRRVTVAGIAITAGRVPYPSATPGLIWATPRDAARMRVEERRWVRPLRLADPSSARAFAAAHPGVTAWQDLGANATAELRIADRALTTAAWAIGLLAVPCVALLVGGRLAEQHRRVGLLKAAGATPVLVAAVLLAEYLIVALVAAVIGLLAGRAAAPLLSRPNAGLLDDGATAPLTAGTASAVVCAALAVAAAATLLPAIRGARTSTVAALTGPAGTPKHRRWSTALSARLPVPLLLGVRIAARRPRRTALATLSLTIGVAMVVAAISLRRDITARDARTVGPMFVPGAGNPVTERAGEIILVLAVALFALAAINTVITAWTTSLDTMRPVAVIGALGATPRQITSGLSAAQLLPALAASVAGIPLGLLVHAAAWAAGGGAGQAGPPSPWLLAVLPGTLLVVFVLTATPIRRICHRPIPELLATHP